MCHESMVGYGNGDNDKDGNSHHDNDKEPELCHEAKVGSMMMVMMIKMVISTVMEMVTRT